MRKGTLTHSAGLVVNLSYIYNTIFIRNLSVSLPILCLVLCASLSLCLSLVVFTFRLAMEAVRSQDIRNAAAVREQELVACIEREREAHAEMVQRLQEEIKTSKAVSQQQLREVENKIVEQKKDMQEILSEEMDTFDSQVLAHEAIVEELKKEHAIKVERLRREFVVELGKVNMQAEAFANMQKEIGNVEDKLHNALREQSKLEADVARKQQTIIEVKAVGSRKDIKIEKLTETNAELVAGQARLVEQIKHLMEQVRSNNAEEARLSMEATVKELDAEFGARQREILSTKTSLVRMNLCSLCMCSCMHAIVHSLSITVIISPSYLYNLFACCHFPFSSSGCRGNARASPDCARKGTRSRGRRTQKVCLSQSLGAR